MKARDRAAHDADETERENCPVDRAAAIGIELIDRRGFEFRIGDDHRADEQRHRADLQQAGKIIARAEQQPHRQHRGNEAVQANRPNRSAARKLKPGLERRAWNPAADDRDRERGDRSDDRRFDDAPFPQPVHVKADEERDRNRAGDSERAPGTSGDFLMNARR